MEKKSSFRELFSVYGLSFLIVLTGFIVAYQFVGPAPTKNIVIATGGQSGAYYVFGLRYADYFKKSNVDLSVLETEGSIDNLAQLMEDGRNVHAALVQGGVGTPEDFPILESLGSLYYEPLWLFHAKTSTLRSLNQLKGKRIALGNQGSGTYALASQLLAENGVTRETAQFVDLGDTPAKDALASGGIDALFVVAGTNSETVQRLLEDSSISVYSFKRAEAYVRNYKYLSKVLLPQGCVSLEHNIPAEDTVLVAPTANLVVRRDLHPALMYLFMMAAEEAHRQGGLLEPQGAFPNARAVNFPLNKEARRFYKSGPPFLMEILPFWIATWLVRMFVMVIPLLTIFYPLFKIAPPTYKWRVRRKVNKFYKELHEIDLQVNEARGAKGLDALRHRLDDIEHRALSVQVPVSHMDAQYTLRRHIALLRERMKRAEAPVQHD
jgi:TRAP transporter TAXI family solute receptor